MREEEEIGRVLSHSSHVWPGPLPCTTCDLYQPPIKSIQVRPETRGATLQTLVELQGQARASGRSWQATGQTTDFDLAATPGPWENLKDGLGLTIMGRTIQAYHSISQPSKKKGTSNRTNWLGGTICMDKSFVACCRNGEI